MSTEQEQQQKARTLVSSIRPTQNKAYNLVVNGDGMVMEYDDVPGLPDILMVEGAYNAVYHEIAQDEATVDYLESRLSIGARTVGWLHENIPAASPEMLCAAMVYSGRSLTGVCSFEHALPLKAKRLLHCLSALDSEVQPEFISEPDEGEYNVGLVPWAKDLYQEHAKTPARLQKVFDRAKARAVSTWTRVKNGVQSFKDNRQGSFLTRCLDSGQSALTQSFERMRDSYSQEDMRQARVIVLAYSAASAEYNGETVFDNLMSAALQVQQDANALVESEDEEDGGITLPSEGEDMSMVYGVGSISGQTLPAYRALKMTERLLGQTECPAVEQWFQGQLKAMEDLGRTSWAHIGLHDSDIDPHILPVRPTRSSQRPQ